MSASVDRRDAGGSPPAPRRAAGRVARAAARAVLALALAAGLFWANEPGRRRADGRFDRGANGVWVWDEWFARAHSPKEMSALGGKLRGLGATWVYARLCPVNSDGGLPAYSAETVERFARGVRGEVPGARVLAWVGGVQGRQFRLEDPAFRGRFCDACARLVREGRLDGVHVNVEGVRNGDPRLPALLAELRRALRPGPAISVACFPPAHPWRAPWGVAWDPDYLGEIAARSDQVVLMMYDTGAPAKRLYTRVAADLTAEALRALAARPDSARLMVGVPTYPPRNRPARDAPFDLPSALAGVTAGLERSRPFLERFDGVALYRLETADAEERAEFDRRWRGRGKMKGSEAASIAQDE